MEKEPILPDYVTDKYKLLFNSLPFPNIVRTRNITREGLYSLIEKNELKWSYSNFVQVHDYIEGIISWGKTPTLLYFSKVQNEDTYKLQILTNNLDNIKMLLVGLNKFFTIDKI
jgi:hypothetical protein